ncbi:MAG: hypothetical protein ABUS54_05640 [Actinomycetota bacterium]
MSTTPPDLVDFAEAPSWFLESRPGRVVRVDDRFALWADLGRTYAAVEGIRLREDQLAGAIADVDAFLHETGTLIASWWFCERSTPDEAACIAAGLEKDEKDYVNTAMLLTEEPPSVDGVEARRVATFEEYVDARLVQRSSFPTMRDADFEAEWSAPHDPLYAAWIDGRIAAAGRATFASAGVYLTGGATAEWARGRGAYRAVVRARWDDAVAAGTPALGVGAGSMSRPILERLGFAPVHEYRRLQSVRSDT